MNRQQTITILALGVVYVVWGSTFYGVKLALEGGFPPFLLVAFRFLLAGLALYGFSRWRGEPAATWGDWWSAAWLSCLLLVAGTGLVAWSVQWIPSSLAALLVATSPVWVTLLDREQPLTAKKVVGLLLGLVGVGWLVGASLHFADLAALWGGLACLASALAWAVGSLCSRRHRTRLSPVTMAGLQMIWAGLVLLAVSRASGEIFRGSEIELSAWGWLVYLTLFGSLLAYSAYLWLVAHVNVTVVLTHAYVNPVVAVVLGSQLGGERLAAPTWWAAAVVLLGVVVLMLPEPRRNMDRV